MKKMRFAACLAALALVLGFSSCLESDNPDYPQYQASVTVVGDNTLGYTLYADQGPILLPTSQSASQLAGLKDVERAIVYFDLVNPAEGPNLSSNKQYPVVLHPQYQPIPCARVIDRYQNAASDSLVRNQDPILDMENLFVKNGYANVGISFMYDPSLYKGFKNPGFHMNTAYDSQVDSDPATNTLTMQVYFDQVSKNAYSKGASLFSFRLPEVERYKFSGDSITLVLKAKADDLGATTAKELKCKMALKDFSAPRY